MSERRIRQGGLMRCCLASIDQYEGDEVPGTTTTNCLYCHAQIRLADDGMWEWDR